MLNIFLTKELSPSQSIQEVLPRPEKKKKRIFICTKKQMHQSEHVSEKILIVAIFIDRTSTIPVPISKNNVH
jgi:hypothetical protein